MNNEESLQKAKFQRVLETKMFILDYVVQNTYSKTSWSIGKVIMQQIIKCWVLRIKYEWMALSFKEFNVHTKSLKYSQHILKEHKNVDNIMFTYSNVVFLHYVSVFFLAMC